MNVETVRRRTALFGAVVACLMAAGCAAYRLGSSLPPGLRTVHVGTFSNRSGEPMLEVEATQAVIRELQKDGALRVVPDPAMADAILEVALTSHELEPLRYDRNDPRSAKEFRQRIAGRLTLRWTKSGVTILDRDVEGQSSFRSAGDAATAKRSAIPATAQDLARNIVKSVVEYW